MTVSSLSELKQWLESNKISEVEDSFVDEFFYKLDDDLKFN